MYTYEDYLKMPGKVKFEDLNRIYETLCAEVETEDEDFQKYWDKALEKAYDYACFREQWYLWPPEKRMEKDELRTATHDSWIARLNTLDRYMEKRGWKHTWRGILGDSRKVIGDFAVFLMFIYGLNAR